MNVPRGMKQTVGRAKAIYSYNAVKDDELSLKPGDMINVYKMDLPDQGWWFGELNGSVGVFPENFVRLLTNSGDRNQGDDSSHAISDLKVIPPKPVLPPQPKVSAINKPKIIPKAKESHMQNAVSGNQSTEGLDCIKPSSKLSNVTAGRVKGPVRRPPTRPTVDPGLKAPVVSGVAELDCCWGVGKGPTRRGSEEELLERPEVKPLEAKRPQKPSVPAQKKPFDNAPKPDARVDLAVTVEEYEAMQKELQALRADLREQVQTNERMVQTLRNFLQDEREKIKLLTNECNQIKTSYLSKIGFL